MPVFAPGLFAPRRPCFGACRRGRSFCLFDKGFRHTENKEKVQRAGELYKGRGKPHRLVTGASHAAAKKYSLQNKSILLIYFYTTAKNLP